MTSKPSILSTLYFWFKISCPSPPEIFALFALLTLIVSSPSPPVISPRLLVPVIVIVSFPASPEIVCNVSFEPF